MVSEGSNPCFSGWQASSSSQWPFPNLIKEDPEMEECGGVVGRFVCRPDSLAVAAERVLRLLSRGEDLPACCHANGAPAKMASKSITQTTIHTNY